MPEFINGFSNDEPLKVDTEGDFDGVPVFVSSHASLNLLAAEGLRNVEELFQLEGWGTRSIAGNGSVKDFTLRGGSTQYLDVDKPIMMSDDEFIQRYETQCAEKITFLKNN